MRVLIRSAFSPYSGYGNDGLGLARAFLRRGVDLYLDPMHMSPPIDQSIANLMTKTLAPPFDLILDHQDPGLIGKTDELRRASECVIGATMWEWDCLDNNPGACKTMAQRMGNLHMVLPYDRVTAQAVQPFLDFPGAPQMHILQGGYETSDWSYVERDWNSEPFRFCMLGQMSERKDPFTAINAFRMTRERHPDFTAELHIKSSNVYVHPLMAAVNPGLHVYAETWTLDQVKQFYANMHCLLAPSRGEGKNLPALEFMTTGGAVVATNWGGHAEWMSDSIAYPLDFKLMPETGWPTCRNARASEEHLSELMWHIFTHRGEAQHKGEVASAIIPRLRSWDAYVNGLLMCASQLPDGRGRRISELIGQLPSR